MKGFVLELKQAARLLGYTEEAVVQLVNRDKLVAEYSNDSLSVSLDSIIRYVGVAAEDVAVRGVQLVLQDESAWKRVFGAAPGIPVMGDFEQLPMGAVGRSLRRAVAISEIRCA